MNTFVKSDNNHYNEIGNYDYHIDIFLVGEQYVGKTSLVFRYSTGSFSMPYMPSTGVDFKEVFLKASGRKIRLKLWDTGKLSWAMYNFVQQNV